MKTIAIIPAGGKGLRSGFAAPKQYLKFYGKELIVYTLDVFQRNKLIDEIVISASNEYIPLIEKLRIKYKLSKISGIVRGGKERQDSVFNALKSVNANKEDLIAVHDAARPLLPSKILTSAVQKAKEKGNALVCLKTKDTLVKAADSVRTYLNREEIYQVQTPQIFSYGDLLKAMEKAYADKFYGTDESMLIRRTGKKVNLAEGSLLNFKVTTKEDIELLKKLLK